MKNTILIGLSVLIFSCSNPNKIEERVIDLLVAPESEVTKISEIATKIEYIPLQTSQNCLIPYIMDVQKNKQKFFI